MWYPIWLLLRLVTKYFRRDRWPYCQYVDPYNKLVKAKAKELNYNPIKIMDFVATIPWKAEKGDTWHRVEEILSDVSKQQDCEEHAYLWVSLMIASGHRGRVHCIKGTVYGRYGHLWCAYRMGNLWWEFDTHSQQTPHLFLPEEEDKMSHKPEFWFDDLGLAWNTEI